MEGARQLLEKSAGTAGSLTLGDVSAVAGRLAESLLPGQPEAFAREVLQIAAVMDEHGLTDQSGGQRLLAEHAGRALRFADGLSPEEGARLLLVGCCDPDLSAETAAAMGVATGPRSALGRLWLRTLLRLVLATGEPPPLPRSNIQPPSGPVRRSGVTAESISDPADREAYQRALADESAAAERYQTWHRSAQMVPEVEFAAREFLDAVFASQEPVPSQVEAFLGHEGLDKQVIEAALEAMEGVSF